MLRLWIKPAMCLIEVVGKISHILLSLLAAPSHPVPETGFKKNLEKHVKTNKTKNPGFIPGLIVRAGTQMLVLTPHTVTARREGQQKGAQ